MNTETSAKNPNKGMEIFRGAVGSKKDVTFTIHDVVDTCRKIILSENNFSDVKKKCVEEGFKEIYPKRIRKLRKGDIILTMIAPIEVVGSSCNIAKEFEEDDTDYTPDILFEDTAFLIGYLLHVSRMRNDIEHEFFMTEVEITNIIDSTVSFLSEVLKADVKRKRKELM